MITIVVDVTAYRSSNSDMYRTIPSAQIQPIDTKLIRQHFTVQMKNDQKHTVKATQWLLKAKKLLFSSIAKSVT